MSKLLQPKQISSGSEGYILTTSGGTTQWTPPTGGGASKYAGNDTFTANVTKTITHNLGSTDVIVQVKDPSGVLVIPRTVNNYLTNSVDINVSVTGTYRVIIIG